MNIENPAFHLFIRNEQAKRDANNKLSVFHLITMYEILIGKNVNLQNPIVKQLIDDKLVIVIGSNIRLAAEYDEAVNRTRFDNGTLKSSKDIIKLVLQNIENNDDTYKRTLWGTLNKVLNGTLKRTLNERQFSVLIEIAVNEGIQGTTISNKTGVSTRTVIKIISYLASEPIRLVEHRGSKKAGGYYLTSNCIDLFTKTYEFQKK